MGECKDQMKKTPTTDLTKKGRFDFLRKRKGPDKPDLQDEAQTFVDRIVKAEETLSGLITTKTQDLANEGGREEYNRKALSLLKTMSYHLDEVCEAAAQYGELS